MAKALETGIIHGATGPAGKFRALHGGDREAKGHEEEKYNLFSQA